MLNRRLLVELFKVQAALSWGPHEVVTGWHAPIDLVMFFSCFRAQAIMMILLTMDSGQLAGAGPLYFTQGVYCQYVLPIAVAQLARAT